MRRTFITAVLALFIPVLAYPRVAYIFVIQEVEGILTVTYPIGTCQSLPYSLVLNKNYPHSGIRESIIAAFRSPKSNMTEIYTYSSDHCFPDTVRMLHIRVSCPVEINHVVYRTRAEKQQIVRSPHYFSMDFVGSCARCARPHLEFK